MVDPGLMERTADKLLSAIVEDDMPLEKVGHSRAPYMPSTIFN